MNSVHSKTIANKPTNSFKSPNQPESSMSTVKSWLERLRVALIIAGARTFYCYKSSTYLWTDSLAGGTK